MVIRRGADAAEAEYKVPGIEAATESRRQPLAFIAHILRPCEAQSPRGQGLDDECEVLVLALADEDFVSDDIGADHGADSTRRRAMLPARRVAATLRSFLRPALELFQPADVPAVD